MIFDPSRQKDVALTPEEQVRQAAVQWLVSACGVPLHLLETEFSLSRIQKGNSDRVDLLVHGFRNGATVAQPWLLAECKREGESDWASLQIQVNKYLRVLRPQHILLCVGADWRILSYKAPTGYVSSPTLPQYPH